MLNSKFKTKFEAKEGFTLIETMVALALIVAAVSGPVLLISSGLFNFSFAKNKLIAANLAQEGIELVHQIRDNNVICDFINGAPPYAWDNDPAGGKLGGEYKIDVNDTASIGCGASLITTPKPSGGCNVTPLSLDSNNIYTYLGGIRTTPFFRCVEICSPPSSSPCFGTNDPGIPSSDQMDVISTVTWTERDDIKTLKLRVKLYRWLQP